MVLKSWAMLLLLPVFSNANSASFEEQEDLKQSHYTLTHKSNVHIASKVTEESPVTENVPEKLPNWQSDSLTQQIQMLKSVVGTDIQKCLNLLNPISTSSPMNSRLKTDIQRDNNLDFKFCVLREQWQQYMLIDVQSNLKTRRIFDFDNLLYIKVPNINWNNTFDFKKEIHPKYKGYEDCLYFTRSSVKPFPGNCYTKLYYVNEQNEFWRFWGEIGPDLMYTYDFVLFGDPQPNPVANQLWYLIAFVRAIVIHSPNPYDFIKKFNGVDNYADKRKSLTDRVIKAGLQIAYFNKIQVPRLAKKIAEQAG